MGIRRERTGLIWTHGIIYNYIKELTNMCPVSLNTFLSVTIEKGTLKID